MHEFSDLSWSLQGIRDATILVGVIGNDIRDIDAIFTVLGDGTSVKGSPEFRIVVVLVLDNYAQRGCKQFCKIVIATQRYKKKTETE